MSWASLQSNVFEAYCTAGSKWPTKWRLLRRIKLLKTLYTLGFICTLVKYFQKKKIHIQTIIYRFVIIQHYTQVTLLFTYLINLLLFQLDVVSLYLLFLVQMIQSGLQVIYTMDEVVFIQNLVYYVERAYRTPDFGVWQRGSKYNDGSPEIHARSQK